MSFTALAWTISRLVMTLLNFTASSVMPKLSNCPSISANYISESSGENAGTFKLYFRISDTSRSLSMDTRFFLGRRVVTRSVPDSAVFVGSLLSLILAFSSGLPI